MLLLGFNNNTVDASRYAHVGYANDTDCSSTAAGKFNTSCRFNGLTSIISYNGSALNLNQSFTISLWVNASQYVSLSRPLIKGTSASFNYMLSPDAEGDNMRCRVNNATGVIAVSDPSTFSLGTPIYFACSSNTSHLLLYRNGALIAVTNLGANLIFDSGNLTIGRESTGINPWNGSIDEVRIWNRTLSNAEINSSYQAEFFRFGANFTMLKEGNYTYSIDANNSLGTRNLTVNMYFIVNNTYKPYLPDVDMNFCFTSICTNCTQALGWNTSCQRVIG